MNLESMFAAIPYVAHHRIEVVREDQGDVEVRLPMNREVTNYVGTMHAGALFTAAESAAGAVAYGVVPGGRAFGLLRGAEITYARRAEADVIARARVDEAAAAAARAALEETGRGDVAIEVTITDPDGEVVFRGAFDYALRPAKR